MLFRSPTQPTQPPSHPAHQPPSQPANRGGECFLCSVLPSNGGSLMGFRGASKVLCFYVFFCSLKITCFIVKIYSFCKKNVLPSGRKRLRCPLSLLKVFLRAICMPCYKMRVFYVSRRPWDRPAFPLVPLISSTIFYAQGR